jgi:hypothetical protein
VEPSGIVTTIAGTGPNGFAGDGGSALSASFFNIHGLAVGPDGAIYVSDTNRVRKIKDAVVQLFAGGGTASGDGPALGLALNAQGLGVCWPLSASEANNRRCRAGWRTRRCSQRRSSW